MKKYLSSLLVISFVVLTACQGGPPGSQTSQQNQSQQAAVLPADPFKGDYTMDENIMKILADGDSVEDAAFSTSYYGGAQVMPLPILTEFTKLRAAKVEEAIKLSGNIYAEAQKLRDAMVPLKEAHLGLLAQALEKDVKLQKFAEGVTAEFGFYQAKEKMLEASLESMQADASNAFSPSTTEYIKTGIEMEYGAAVTEDFYVFLANSAKLAQALELLQNEALKQPLADFNALMEKAGDSVNGPIVGIQKNIVLTSVALRQIDTGDYYMTLAGLQYIQENLPALKEKLASLKPTEDIEQEDIDIIGEYIGYYERYVTGMMAKLEQYDYLKYTLPLEIGPSETALVPVARAGFMDTAKWVVGGIVDTADAMATKVENATAAAIDTGVAYGKAGYQVVESGVSTVVNYGVGVAQSTAHGIASGYNTVTTALDPFSPETWAQIKFFSSLPKTLVGAALDEMSVETRLALEKTIGKYYYGKSDSHIADLEKELRTRQLGNILIGRAGSETLQNAKIGMEKVENVTAGLVEKGFEKVFDPGWMSWSAGKVTNMAVGAFTGLAKGLYTLADPTSGNLDNAGALFDIGFSLIGGSKSFVKGTDVISGTSKAATGFIDKAANWLAKKFASKKVAALKNQLDDAKRALSTPGLDSDTRAAAAALKKKLTGWLGNAVGDERQLIKNGEALTDNLKSIFSPLLPGSIVKNTEKEMLEALKGAVVQQFGHGIKGYYEAFKAMVGGNPLEIFNNVCAGVLDNKVSDTIKGLLGSTLFPWNVVLCDGAYGGVWKFPGGAFPVAGKIEGNSFTAAGSYVMTYYGVVVATTFGLDGTVDNEGKLSGTVNGGGSIKGQIKGKSSGGGSFTGSCDGETVTINYDVSGVTNISGTGGYGGGSFVGGDKGTLTLSRAP